MYIYPLIGFKVKKEKRITGTTEQYQKAYPFFFGGTKKAPSTLRPLPHQLGRMPNSSSASFHCPRAVHMRPGLGRAQRHALLTPLKTLEFTMVSCGWLPPKINQRLFWCILQRSDSHNPSHSFEIVLMLENIF